MQNRGKQNKTLMQIYVWFDSQGSFVGNYLIALSIYDSNLPEEIWLEIKAQPIFTQLDQLIITRR